MTSTTPSLSTTPRATPSITRPKRKPSVPISPLFPAVQNKQRSVTTTLILVAVTFLLFLQWSVYGGGERLGERVEVGLGNGYGGKGGVGGIRGNGEGVVHVVLVEFRVGVELEVIEFYCNRFLSLKEKAVKEENGKSKPYIRSIKGGKDVSGLQHKLTHIFILEFATEDDKRYYLEKDQAHMDYQKSVEDIVKDTLTLDFVPGEWGTPTMGERGGS